MPLLSIIINSREKKKYINTFFVIKIFNYIHNALLSATPSNFALTYVLRSTRAVNLILLFIISYYFQFSEYHSVRQTDSMSNLSDLSANTAIPSVRPRMDVICVIDTHQTENLNHRKYAFEEIKLACSAVNANFIPIQFEKLDFGETNILDSFYNADVALVDLSIQLQQSSLSYHLGVRESFGMKENVLMYNDTDTEATIRLKISCGSYTFLPYKLLENGSCVVTNPVKGKFIEESPDAKQSLLARVKKLFQDVEIQSK